MLNPTIWGPSMWRFLEGLAAAYPETNPSADAQCAMRTLIFALGAVYPCPECRFSAAKFLRRDHAALLERALCDGSAAMHQFVCALHNSVNRKLHKEEQQHGGRKGGQSKAFNVVFLCIAYDHPENAPTAATEEFYRFWAALCAFRACVDGKFPCAAAPPSEKVLAGGRESIIQWTFANCAGGGWTRAIADNIFKGCSANVCGGGG